MAIDLENIRVTLSTAEADTVVDLLEEERKHWRESGTLLLEERNHADRITRVQRKIIVAKFDMEKEARSEV